jgi:subtilase family serine protease
LGDLFGNDFRNAYVPGTTLTGAGQSVGLVEFDGYFTNDIFNYANEAGNGRTNIIIEPVLLDGYNGKPSTGINGGEGEVELDIEMAMAIAPGLARIVSYEAGESGNPNDVLNAMLANSNVVNLSCSWGWNGPSNTTDGIFESMDAVGQSFFQASGDSQAFTPGSNSINGVDNPATDNAPSSNPYITQVGGTTLTMNGTGASWASEVVWNWAVEENEPGVGSSGGSSSYYPIPSWQTNVSNMAGRGGSTSFRNIPDVAANADHVYEIYDNGNDRHNAFDDNAGTSCAAPLWAGFMALVNQQSAANGGKSVGFINPAIYAIATGSNYASCFHDVTSGNNTWSASPNLFYATNNYDLCTGLGTMNGTNFINALAATIPTPTLLSPALTAGGVILSWNTVAGISYQLQYTSDLGTTNWSNFGSAITASGSVATVSDSLANSQRFYRVLLKPQPFVHLSSTRRFLQSTIAPCIFALPELADGFRRLIRPFTIRQQQV